jgi:hypothetical protein
MRTRRATVSSIGLAGIAADVAVVASGRVHWCSLLEWDGGYVGAMDCY